MQKAKAWFLTFRAVIRFVAFAVTGLTVFAGVFSGVSYWLRLLFHLMAWNVTVPCTMLALLVSVYPDGRRFSWPKFLRAACVWLLVIVVNLTMFLFAGFTRRLTPLVAHAQFGSFQYYLVRTEGLGTYDYDVYQCYQIGLWCRRSSGYVGIPYQRAPITFAYDHTSKNVYIQNLDEMIEIPW